MSEKDKPKKQPVLMFSQSDMVAQKIQDRFNEQIAYDTGKTDELMNTLVKSMTAPVAKKRPRLAFVDSPNRTDHYAGIYKIKNDLLPDNAIKKIRVQNFLIASILRTRGAAMSMMGHPRKDRFSVGFELEIKPEFKDFIEPEQMPQIQERMDRVKNVFLNCGYTEGVVDSEKMTLSDFLDIQIRNGIAFGRHGTEFVYDGEDKFNRFRPVDIGTIYPVVKKGETAEPIRRSSIKMLETLTGEKFNMKDDLYNQGEYCWVQAIDGIPRQAFTSKELAVYNMYPSTDVEHNGYPVTPIDTVLTSIISHMSIEVYNKLYFQNGRAAKGFLVVKSDEVDQTMLEEIKQGYNASINDVTNSFRTPIFGLNKEDDIEWITVNAAQKDGEFEFLFDQTTRNILSAFNMSPDELPGFGHLSKATGAQALSEADNSYKLTQSKETGMFPLIMKMEDFLNNKIFPVVDPELAQLCTIVLGGFDAKSRTQESTQLNMDVPIHYTYDEIMEEVDKKPVGEALGGKIPLSERYRQVADSYISHNYLVGEFTNSPAAYVDPILKYKRDAFFFQNLALIKDGNPSAYQAYMSSRIDSMDILKTLLGDFLEEEGEE